MVRRKFLNGYKWHLQNSIDPAASVPSQFGDDRVNDSSWNKWLIMRINCGFSLLSIMAGNLNIHCLGIYIWVGIVELFDVYVIVCLLLSFKKWKSTVDGKFRVSDEPKKRERPLRSCGAVRRQAPFAKLQGTGFFICVFCFLSAADWLEFPVRVECHLTNAFQFLGGYL